MITRAIPGAGVAQTGIEQLSAGGSAGGSSVMTEILIGGALALLVLLWVFGSALAILPLISAPVSTLTMQLAIYGLTYVTNIHINPAAQFIVALLGYLHLSTSPALTVDTFARLYQVEPARVRMYHHRPALAIKIGVPRPHVQSALDDPDCCGGQQYSLLLDLAL
ncbi:hypothetical protein JOF29_007368 [Kribbella aluminosa]|uniref:DUF4387 domain-containing protein n=1 Tax=Kribbella aluminosa TaxID=416017 RepID=A0ABS4UXB0_9ACTN|nr:DUF4387 family protein [Kribbella aluminosa]MBP2356258.1 hypothetical protein [Kribbella aluminosa]